MNNIGVLITSRSECTISNIHKSGTHYNLYKTYKYIVQVYTEYHRCRLEVSGGNTFLCLKSQLRLLLKGKG